MRKEHYFGYFLTFQSSRALILKRAVEYIAMMQKQIAENQSDIAQLRQQNKELETQSKLYIQENTMGEVYFCWEGNIHSSEEIQFQCNDRVETNK